MKYKLLQPKCLACYFNSYHLRTISYNYFQCKVLFFSLSQIFLESQKIFRHPLAQINQLLQEGFKKKRHLETPAEETHKTFLILL